MAQSNAYSQPESIGSQPSIKNTVSDRGQTESVDADTYGYRGPTAYLLKKSTYKCTCTVHTHVIQQPTVIQPLLGNYNLKNAF